MLMTDFVSPEKRRAIMRKVRQKDTAPEIRVRGSLHSIGYRYRLHCADLPGKPDIVFPGRRKAIFVNGCFWHQHPGCSKATTPKTRTDWWQNKLDRNVERDNANLLTLQSLGWEVTVVWECETKKMSEVEPRLIEFLERQSDEKNK